MELGDVSTIVITVSGIVGTITAYVVAKRGQRNDEKQQDAKTKLEERIAAFDELESLNDRLGTENARLTSEASRMRDLVAEAEARGDLRLAQQAARCRSRMDDMTATISVLQGVVVAEIARAQAGDAIETAARHVAAEHPEPEQE